MPSLGEFSDLYRFNRRFRPFRIPSLGVEIDPRCEALVAQIFYDLDDELEHRKSDPWGRSAVMKDRERLRRKVRTMDWR
jgi:hypothetical protein